MLAIESPTCFDKPLNPIIPGVFGCFRDCFSSIAFLFFRSDVSLHLAPKSLLAHFCRNSCKQKTAVLAFWVNVFSSCLNLWKWSIGWNLVFGMERFFSLTASQNSGSSEPYKPFTCRLYWTSRWYKRDSVLLRSKFVCLCMCITQRANLFATAFVICIIIRNPCHV